MPAFIVADHGSTASRIVEILKFGGHDCTSSNVMSLDGASGRLSREAAIDLVVVALCARCRTQPRYAADGLSPGPGRSWRWARPLIPSLSFGPCRGGAVIMSIPPSSSPSSRRPSAGCVEAARGPSQTARLVAVFSPNGGSGSSTIAANLAAVLAKEHKSAGLIDLKLEAGDLSALLDLKPTFTLADLCRNSSKLDRVMFERSLVKHETGIGLLAAPHHLDDIGLIRPEGIAQALTLARASFPFVVADLDHSYREEQRVVLRQADFVLIPFRLDFASLRNVRRALEHLDGAGYPARQGPPHRQPLRPAPRGPRSQSRGGDGA